MFVLTSLQAFVKQPKAEGNMVNEMGLDDFGVIGKQTIASVDIIVNKQQLPKCEIFWS